MKNKKMIIIISVVFLILVLLISLVVGFYAQLIEQEEKAEASKQYQSVLVNKEIAGGDNYSLACKLININDQTIGSQDQGVQKLTTQLSQGSESEFEIKIENEKAVIWDEDYQIINNNNAYLTLYRYDRDDTADNSKTISIDKANGNGFFTWTSMFLAENTMTSAVISCREE